MKYTWDATGNLTQRENVLVSETESFGYDSLDRLVSVSGPYSASYAYSPIGNITSMNGVGYTYGSQPHAVTQVGTTGYAYNANGNMTVRDDQTIEWDAENRPVSVSDGVDTSTFVYDGDGNRVLRTEGSDIVLYINTYYEKNLTTGEVITSYYLGDQLIATRTGDTLEYVHHDHLSGTALVSDSSGDLVDDISYYPYGSTRAGDVPTDKKFTGQRLDGTGLYYYGARYYDPLIGRFISADTIVPDPMNPQNFNRYSYCVNNPLRYVDPTGHNTLELNIPQEWLEYSWLERLWYLTPEERAYLKFALNPPPIEGDLLPVNDTSWDEALMNAGPGYLLEVSWGSLMTYEYIIIESDSINTPIDVSYLESTSAWECPGVEYLGGTELVVVVMRNAPGYLECSYNVQFTWGKPYPYVLRTKEDLLIELDICIEKYGQPQITLYSPYGNMVGQWGDEWNLVGDMPPKTIAQEIGKEVVEFWVDFIIKKIVGGYFFGD